MREEHQNIELQTKIHESDVKLKESSSKGTETAAEIAKPEIAKLEVLRILQDTQYWKKNSNYSFSAPDGIRDMQKTLAEKPGAELLSALKVNATEALEKKPSRFFSRERCVMTSIFYGLFKDHSSWEGITNSMKFKQLQGNYKTFQHDQPKKTAASPTSS